MEELFVYNVVASAVVSAASNAICIVLCWGIVSVDDLTCLSATDADDFTSFFKILALLPLPDGTGTVALGLTFLLRCRRRSYLFVFLLAFGVALVVVDNTG